MTNLLNTVDFDALVQSKIRLDSSLSYEDAVEEVVADACEMMLRDSTLIERLAKTNQSLYEKIRDWLIKFAEDVRKAFEGQEARHTEAMVMAEHIDELVELWDKGLETAGSGDKSRPPRPNRVRNEIRISKKGTPFVVISEDILAGVPEKEWRLTVNNKLKSKFPNGILIGNGEIYIDSQSRKEMTYSKYTRFLEKYEPNLFADKLRATPNSDEILIATQNWINEGLNHPRKDKITDFARGNALIRIGKNDYVVDVVVAREKSGKLKLYDTLGFSPTVITEKETDTSIPHNPSPGGRRKNVSISNTKVSQPSPKVKKSVRDNYVELTDADWNRAEEHFGTTRNYDVAGYLLPDGKMLDFSGRHWGDSSSTMRQVEHRDIQEVWEDDESRNLSGFDEETNAIANGAVRLMPESGGINLAVPPSAEQIKTLRGFINHFSGQVILDIDNMDHQPIMSHSYDRGTSSSRVIEDINNYFRDGTLPTSVSETAKFRYSRRDSDGSLREGQRLTYDALVSKPDMPVTVVNSNISMSRAEVVSQAKKNALSYGSQGEAGNPLIYVKDIGTNVLLGTKSLRHGLDRRFQVNATVSLHAGEIIANSVCINELVPKRQEADNTYVLIGAAKNQKNELYIVEIVVNSFSNEGTSMDVVYSINAKTEAEIKTESAGSLSPRLTGLPATLTDSKISIATLLDYVNKYFPDILSMDVLRHYGMETRPKGELGTRAKYSRRDNVENNRIVPDEVRQTKGFVGVREDGIEVYETSDTVKNMKWKDRKKTVLEDNERAVPGTDCKIST